MKYLLYTIMLAGFASTQVRCQYIAIEDLLKLSSLQPNHIDNFMNRNGYTLAGSKLADVEMVSRYFEKSNGKKKKDTLTKRSIDIFKQKGIKYFSYYTTSLNEYLDGQRWLIKDDFFYDHNKDMNRDSLLLYQKGNIVVKASTANSEGHPLYTLQLSKKEIPRPDSIRNAEDLLQFNSHEYLVSFFGEKNVKKDLYYLSEKELKKCSVIFGNTPRQAVFVWADENNLCDLSFIIVSNIIHTVGAKDFDGVIGTNEWELKNGIYPGMNITELLKINQKDFEFYGNKSVQAFMVKPENTGKIDFKKTIITLSCSNCNNDKLFNTSALNALDVAEENLPVYVYNIIIFPEHQK